MRALPGQSTVVLTIYLNDPTEVTPFCPCEPRTESHGEKNMTPDARVISKLRLFLAVLLLAWVGVAPAWAQHYQSDFPPEEFRARWEGVFDRIENAPSHDCG